MIPVPFPGTDPNADTLRRLEKDDFTGIVIATVTLSQKPVENYILVWKNGLYLHNLAGADWTVAGTTLTFGVALIAGDKVTVWYWTRAN